MARDSWLKRLIWLRGSPAGGSGASYEKTVGPAPIISVADAKAKPAKSLTVGMEPIQDLHGYDSPWPAGGGVNLLDPSKTSVHGEDSSHYGIHVEFDSATGMWSFSGTSRWAGVSAAFNFLSYSDASLSGKSYFIQAFDVSGTGSACFKSVYGFKTESETACAIVFDFSSVQSINITLKISVAATSQTAWSPYSNLCPISGRTGANIYHSGADTSTPSVITVSWQTEAGTVYGGTVDLVSGVLTVTHGTTDLTNLNWSHNGGSVFTAVIDGIYNRAINTQNDAMSNKYSGENVWYGSQLSNGRFMIRGDISRVYIKDENYLSTTEFVNSLGSLQFIYKLATPQTYQLTPQQIQLLKGSNTLWSDADALTLTYLGTTPANLLGGMLGGGFGGGYNPPAEQDPEELTEPEATETDEPAEEAPAEEGENNGE